MDYGDGALENARHDMSTKKSAPEYWNGFFLILKQEKLFLSALVSLIEFVDTTCCIHELYLAGIEWVRGV